MHGAADTAVHPASVGESYLGDLPLFLGLDPKSPGQGRPHHLVHKTFFSCALIQILTMGTYLTKT